MVVSLRRHLEILYDQFGRQMLACAYAVTGCRDLAEDAIHEAFCRLLQLVQPPRDLKAYAFRAVRNAALDLVRRRRGEPFEDDAFFDPADDPRRSAEKAEFERRVQDALARMTEPDREVIVQHLYGELTFREIAELLDLPLGTVTTRYQRAIIRLRDFLSCSCPCP